MVPCGRGGRKDVESRGEGGMLRVGVRECSCRIKCVLRVAPTEKVGLEQGPGGGEEVCKVSV